MNVAVHGAVAIGTVAAGLFQAVQLTAAADAIRDRQVAGRGSRWRHGLAAGGRGLVSFVAVPAVVVASMLATMPSRARLAAVTVLMGLAILGAGAGVVLWLKGTAYAARPGRSATLPGMVLPDAVSPADRHRVSVDTYWTMSPLPGFAVAALCLAGLSFDDPARQLLAAQPGGPPPGSAAMTALLVAVWLLWAATIIVICVFWSRRRYRATRALHAMRDVLYPDTGPKGRPAAPRSTFLPPLDPDWASLSRAVGLLEEEGAVRDAQPAGTEPDPLRAIIGTSAKTLRTYLVGRRALRPGVPDDVTEVLVETVTALAGAGRGPAGR